MSSSRYFRIQTADRDVSGLLDPAQQTSEAWNGQESLIRHGVSVCDSLEDLADYLIADGSGIPYGSGEWVVVELTGTLSTDTALDAGETLIIPTAIISVEPMAAQLFPMIDAAYDALYA
jgi:hypothetical protein